MPQDVAANQPRLRLSDGLSDVSPHLQEDVRALQRALIRWGFPVVVNGKMDPSTDAALRMFQRRQGIADTGVTDSDTWEKLMAADAVPIATGFHPVLSTTSSIAGGQSQQVADSLEGGVGVVLDVPWFSQFDKEMPGAGPAACYKTCLRMLKAANVQVPPGFGAAIRVATKKDTKGRVTVDAAAARQALEYIDGQLTAKRAVLVGVAHSDKAPNAAYGDPLTEHFVVIYGKVTSKDGVTTYRYNDPGTYVAKVGRAGRFTIDPERKILVHEGVEQGDVTQKHTEMTIVIRSVEH